MISDRPKPDIAPYRPAAEVVRQNDRKKPIQLKRNATEEKKHVLKQTISYLTKVKIITTSYNVVNDKSLKVTNSGIGK